MSQQYSKVGDVEKMFNQNFSIVTTNASANDMLNFAQTADESFISSSLIISSPCSDEGIDNCTPSLLVTDYEGHPLRLTYAIKPGNGLVLGYTYATGRSDSLDTLSLAIDNDSLKTTPYGNLYVDANGLTENSQYLSVSGINNVDLNIDSIADNTKLKVFTLPNDHKRLTIDAETLVDNVTLKVSLSGENALKNGFEKQVMSVNLENIVDGATITTASRNGRRVVKVNTDFLDIATPNKAGIVKIDNSTIKINSNKQVYVDTKNLKHVTSTGGTGIVTIPAQGKGDLFVDNSGILRVNPYFMPKCSTEDSSKEGRGFGVCAVDGITLKASANGVISVISNGLEKASLSQYGVVRPDGQTISIDKSGVISVNTQRLNSASASEYGLVKIDGTSIVTNSQGKLCVYGFKELNDAIAAINIKIAGYASQISSLQKSLNDVIAKLQTGGTVSTFSVTSGGNVVDTISFTIPNSRKDGNYVWSMKTINKTFTIRYKTGNIFRFKVSGINAGWITDVVLYVNGNAYSQNNDIKMSSDTSESYFVLRINGYGTNTVQRSEETVTITFVNQSGQILKTILLFVYNNKQITYDGGFLASINGKSNVNSQSADKNPNISRGRSGGGGYITGGWSTVGTCYRR